MAMYIAIHNTIRSIKLQSIWLILKASWIYGSPQENIVWCDSSALLISHHVS